VLGPAIVAESLVAVPDPLVTALRIGPVAAGAEVARALAWSLRPDEELTATPAWLLPHQVPGFRRILAALRRYGGALLADPVGSGKTYIALAVARALGAQPAVCLVPAPLVGQWRATAARLGVPAYVGSHEQASRGHLPAHDRGLVIIDESHHFRHPRTKRYRFVAPWLIGRPTLLLTATPIVNRLPDLAAQLLLGVRSDALAPDGVVSLGALLAEGRSSPALGHLVIESVDAGERPRRTEHRSTATREECASAERLLSLIDRLRLSRNSSVAALVRSVLCGAAASSPVALAAALRRYRTLLLHARDAATAGRAIDRAYLRRFTEGQEDQLVLWELLSDGAAPMELDLTDLQEIDATIGAADHAGRAPDGKLDRLRAVLAAGRPTLVFTSRRATVRYLREALGSHCVAWCTGERAGIGPTAMPRETVWRWFGGEAPAAAGPHILVTTDIAAEGIDLRRVERVVHYDLPYSPMRLEQREGRAIRLGSAHSTVDVVRFAPPRPLDRRLGQIAALARKARLPAAAGLGRGGREHWRWRAELAERYAQGARTAGVARVSPADRAGVLAGFAIDGVAATVLWRDHPAGEWTDDPTVVSERLAQAAESAAIRPVDPEAVRRALAELASMIRHRLATVAGRRWTMPEPGLPARELAARLREQIVAAARCRDAVRLRRLDGVLRFLAGGHTAGEAMLIERTAALPDAELIPAAERLPLRRPAAGGMEVRFSGLVLFEPDRGDNDA
jgi:superfamily II DNA or RNA helicase